MRKILVLRGGALGDFIVTLPALALLRSRWPAAQIEFVGHSTAAALAVDAGLIDRFHSQHDARWSALYASAPLPADLSAELTHFDLVINFWPDPDGDLARRFPLRARQTYLSTSAHPAITPASAHYCAPLGALGLHGASRHFSLATPRPDARLIAIHPGSGSAKKNWLLTRWSDLCQWLSLKHRAELIIITGEADTAATTALTAFGTAAHRLPLRDLIARLSHCRLFIGHDSGISHLAAACSLPSLLLFGPTDPAVWAPPAPHVRVIRHGPTLEEIPLSAVQSALLHEL
jgi:ADP-heptose:LPS heptosyltransferase